MKKRTVWLAVSCFIGLSLVLTSCGPVATEEEKVKQPAAEEEEEEEAIGEVEEITSFEGTFSVGETARSNRLAVTVLEATVADDYEYYDKAEEKTLTKEAKPEMTFLILTVEIKNVGSGERREGLFQTRASDSENDRYRVGSYYGEDRIIQDITISPGESVKGKVLFNIQKGTSDIAFIYNFNKHPDPELLAEWKIQ